MDEIHWVSCLRENFTSSSYGEGLETGRRAPRQSLTRQTDLGSLKGTLRLDQLTCTTPQMVDKEIEIAMMSYNLVRTVICQAAQKAGTAPRRFSFTRVKNAINFYGPKIAAATTGEEAERLLALMNHAIGQAKLYPRKKKRPAYPREIWHSAKPFPRRKAQA